MHLTLLKKAAARLRLALPLIAFWPVYLWYAQRMGDPSDSSWGLLGLAALLWFLYRERTEHQSYLIPSVGLGLYLATFPWAPPLIKAALASIVLVSLASRRLNFGLLGLGMLSLPVIASLQFYLGYPLRLLVAKGASLLLGANGLVVRAEGAALKWGEKLVAVDAPCSGVQMLWVSLFVACFHSVQRGLSNRNTSVLLASAFGLTLAGNVLRASSLFYLESGLMKAPKAAHAAVGLVSFTFIVGALVWLAGRFETEHGQSTKSKGSLPLFLALSVMAAVIPLLVTNPSTEDTENFPGWPTTFEGKVLTKLPLTTDEESFTRRNFPGKMARFTDGQREIILRWVTEPTRTLHPSADCFRGSGYNVGDRGLEENWRVFSVQRNDEVLQIREQITDAEGRVWTDVSAWYWDATLSRGTGPYWSVVVAERKS